MNSDHNKGKPLMNPVVIVIIGILFCSQSSTFVRYSNAPSLVLAMYRKVMITLMLAPFVWLKCREELKQLTKKQWLMCAIGGIFLAVHFATYFESVQRTTVAASQVLTGMEVLYVALIMLAFFHEKLTPWCMAGIVIALVGSVLVAYTGKAATGQTSLAGNLIALFSGLMLALYSLVGSKVRAHCSNILYNFLVYGFSAIALTIFVGFSEYAYFGYDKVNYLTAFGMAICCSLLGHTIFNWSLKYLSPTYVAMLKISSPIFAALAALILFREIPAWNQIVGGLIVMGGIVIYTKNKTAAV